MSEETQARLVYMANQIARNLFSGDEQAASVATADHIRLYWEPRMKKALLTGDHSGLSPVASGAIGLLAADRDRNRR